MFTCAVRMRTKLNQKRVFTKNDQKGYLKKSQFSVFERETLESLGKKKKKKNRFDFGMSVFAFVVFCIAEYTFSFLLRLFQWLRDIHRNTGYVSMSP